MELRELMTAGYIVPAVALGLVGVVLMVIRLVVKNYHTVPPNRVDVISGRKYLAGKDEGGKAIIRGYRVVTGGGYFRWPIIESVQKISLNLMTIPVEVKSAPDASGALVTVRGVTQVKIKSDEDSLALAIERFLGFGTEELEKIAKKTLEGNLRSIVGTMTIEELINDRTALQSKILNEAATDLAKMGLNIDLLTLQEIEDDYNYIASIGKTRTAEVIRNARIGEANANRDADVQAAKARQEGETAKAKADEIISEAERDRDVVKAQNSSRIKAQEARVALIAQQAQAEEQLTLNVAQVHAKKAEAEAAVDLAKVEQLRNQAMLEATSVTTARKEGEATVIRAKASQDAAVLDGEASRIKAEKEGQGEQAKQTAQAIGRKAMAEAAQKELEAQAAGKRAELLAEAEGRKAILLAEAEGALKKAEAFKELDEAGRFLLILEALPPVVEAIGGTIREFMVPVSEAIGKGLANVKEIRLIDLGNGAQGNGKGNVLQQFANMPVDTMFALGQRIRAAGLAPIMSEITKKLGFDLDKLLGQTVEVTASSVEVKDSNLPENVIESKVSD